MHSFYYQNIGAARTRLWRVDEGFLASHTSKNTRHTCFDADAWRKKYTWQQTERENDYLLPVMSGEEKAGSLSLHNSHMASWRGVPFTFLSTEKTESDKYLRAFISCLSSTECLWRIGAGECLHWGHSCHFLANCPLWPKERAHH